MFPKLIRNNHQCVREYVTRHLVDLKGLTLDLGAGKKPYESLFPKGQYFSSDIKGEQTFLCDSEDIPVGNKYFDNVITTQVFEHIPRPWETIKEINRVLKINGNLILTTPMSEEMHEVPNNFFQYTKYGLISLLEKNGFRIIDIVPQSGWYSYIAEQFRTANRRNIHILLFLWPLSEIIIPIAGALLDMVETDKGQTEGWNVYAKKVMDVKR